MAQDLHDGVGHGLAVIAMQAGVGAARAGPRPGAAARSASRRSGTPAGSRWTRCAPSWPGSRATGPATAPRRPPGLADLEALVDRVRTGGLAVDR